MTAPPRPASPRPVGRIVLLALAALLVGYALSDHPLYGGEPGFGTAQWLIAGAGALLAALALALPRAAGSLSLLVVSCLAMLAFAEVAGEFLLGPRHRPIYQPDERLIFKFIPGRRSVMTHLPATGGTTVLHHITADGVRGEPLKPAGAQTRVVVYGDSFIHASYTPDEGTFVAQLGKALSDRLGRPVETVNAGVSSYGPDQVLLRMEDELPRLKPELVVVSIFAGNDYGDLLRNKLFRLGPDGGLQPNRWTLDPQVRMWLELSQRESILLRALRSTRASRQAAPAPAERDMGNMDFLLAESEREYDSFVAKGDNTVTNTHVDYYSADLAMRPSGASARYKVALMHAVMARIRDAAAKNKVPLLFVFVPHPRDLSPEAKHWPPAVDRARFPEYDGRNLVAPLEAAARKLEVPFLSLDAVFRGRDIAGLYLRGGDDHWNEAGQALAAGEAAALIVREKLLGARRAP